MKLKDLKKLYKTEFHRRVLIFIKKKVKAVIYKFSFKVIFFISFIYNFFKPSNIIKPKLKLLEIEPAIGCNLRCIMCHVPNMDLKKVKHKMLDIKQLEKATSGFDGINVIIGSEFEPTINPHFGELLELCKKRDWKVDFLTNATNLHLYSKELMASINFNVFNISFDGIQKRNI